MINYKIKYSEIKIACFNNILNKNINQLYEGVYDYITD